MTKEEMIKLYNALVLVETKGESTKIMAQCLNYIEQQIKKHEDAAVESTNEA